MSTDRCRQEPVVAVETLESRQLYSAAFLPVIRASSVPASLISGTKARSRITVDIENTGDAVSAGSDSISAILSSDGFAADGTVIGTVKESLKIAPKKKATVNILLKSIPSFSDGEYTAVVEVTSASGSLTQSFAKKPVKVAAPYVSLTPSIVGPTIGGRGKFISLPISNSGNVAFHGTTPISLFASSSDTSNSSTPSVIAGSNITESDANSAIVTQEVSLSLPPGVTKIVHISTTPAQTAQVALGASAQVGSSSVAGASTDGALMNFIATFEDGPGNPPHYTVYPDPLDASIQTIGIGSNIAGGSGRAKIGAVFGPKVNYDDLIAGKIELAPSQVNMLYGYDVENALTAANKLFKNFDDLSKNQQIAVVDFTFNTKNAATFKNFVADVNGSDWYGAGQELVNSVRYGQEKTRSDAEIALLQDAHYHSTSELDVTADYDNGTITTTGPGTGPVTTDLKINAVFNSATKSVADTVTGTVIYNLTENLVDTPDNPEDGGPVLRSYVATRTFDLSGPPSQAIGSTPGVGGVIDNVVIQVTDSITGVFTSNIDGSPFGPPSTFT